MSDKQRSKRASQASQPALAQMLFAAIQEHDAALAQVARVLHDDVSQVLSAVGLQLDAMRMDFRNQAPGIDDRASEIQAMLEQVIEQLRDISNELNPSIVERAGLQFALDRLAGKVRKTFSGTLRLHFDSTARVPTEIATTFYKIAECALESAVARPRCSAIDIQLKRAQGDFVLEIRDDAEADDADRRKLPLARLLLDYYASRGHIALDILGAPSRGTIIRASHPQPDSVPEIAS
jgi:two-component system sensor histidine kinase NreB